MSKCIFSIISEKFVTFLSSHIMNIHKKRRDVFILLKLLKLQTHFGAENLCVAKKPKGFMVAKNSDPMLKILYHIMSKSTTIDVSQNYE